ncbi:unnamed protein product [Zymoseptoria tritici ST99CH_1E4]|uniref:Uncharacterized protein n=1 Tax=Zymoseptoria tritici ST99CH_1E4 TaxID=1276532 RepID=A0A2H1FLI0_ZYMTR|nr:unnamed protein product [Zymoseptoria tritici ST99CH_1E4]
MPDQGNAASATNNSNPPPSGPGPNGPNPMAFVGMNADNYTSAVSEGKKPKVRQVRKRKRGTATKHCDPDDEDALRAAQESDERDNVLNREAR